MMEWAANRYSLTPAGVRQAFSMARLLVYFDAYWWTNCAQPPEPETGLDGQPLTDNIDELAMFLASD